jgi:membrane protease YdiL (CAAX protease family)
MEMRDPGPFRRSITRHPYRGAIFFLLLFFLLNLIAGAVVFGLELAPLLMVTVADTIIAIAGILIVLHLSWFRKAGFATLGRRSDLVLYLLPAGIAILALSEGIATSEASMVLLFAVSSLVIALAEEIFFRGLILQALVPVGVRRTVILSAVLFGLPHLFNAAGGVWDPLFTVADTFAAFGIGVAFAALLFRTGTIWPLIFIHALVNFTALLALGSIMVPAQSVLSLAITATAGAVLLIYGLYLVRPGQPVRMSPEGA